MLTGKQQNSIRPKESFAQAISREALLRQFRNPAS